MIASMIALDSTLLSNITLGYLESRIYNEIRNQIYFKY